MDITLFNFDEDRIFTGITTLADAKKPIPKNYTSIAVPEIPEGKLAFFSGGSWTLLDSRPVRPEPVPQEPTPVITTRISRFEFRNRFTTAEKVAIYTAAETNVLIRVFLDDIMAAEFIDVTLPDTIQGVQYLEQQGAIGVGRAMEIIGPLPEEPVDVI